MRIIGDVHGKFRHYLDRLPEKGPSIQIGDMGVGFGLHLPDLPKRHSFFRGNHDAPMEALRHTNCLRDYGYSGGTFWLAGAWSIDRFRRTIGVSWWPNEELSPLELNKAIDRYAKRKPKIMLTHCAPSSVVKTMFGFDATSRTEQSLDCALESWQPELWVFGHYHQSKTLQVDKTKFICLNELETLDI